MRRRIQSLESPHGLFVTDITFLQKRFQVRLNREERASGISDDNSELDNLLEEILEKEKAAKEKLDNDDEDKKNLLRMRRRQLKICENVHYNGLGKHLNERVRKRDRRQKSPSRERVERAQVKQWNI